MKILGVHLLSSPKLLLKIVLHFVTFCLFCAEISVAL